jgi:hypothetical protein
LHQHSPPRGAHALRNRCPLHRRPTCAPRFRRSVHHPSRSQDRRETRSADVRQPGGCGTAAKALAADVMSGHQRAGVGAGQVARNRKRAAGHQDHSTPASGCGGDSRSHSISRRPGARAEAGATSESWGVCSLQSAASRRRRKREGVR